MVKKLSVMNKKGFLPFAIIIFLFCCQNQPDNPPFQGKEFEGVITYRAEYVNFPSNLQYGDTVKIYYSHGNLLKTSNGKNPAVIHHEVLLLAGNKYYFNKGDPDTLYSVDIGDNSSATLDKEIHAPSETRILGHTCEKFIQEMTPTHHKSFHATEEYYYSKDVLRVNKDYFKDRKLEFYNQFIDESGALQLKFIFSYEFPDEPKTHSFSFTAVNIKAEKIDPALFYVDSTKARPYKIY
jgi:hypothetical protein